MSFATSCVCLELRSFPSAGVTGFRGTTNLSATPERPGLSLAGVRLILSSAAQRPPGGFPCCVRFPCVRAAASTPVQRLGVVFADLAQPYQPSPKLQSGRPAHRPFRRLARRSLELRPAHSRRHLYVTSYTEGFSHFVASMTAPVASGWSCSPCGTCTHWKAPPSHGPNAKSRCHCHLRGSRRPLARGIASRMASSPSGSRRSSAAAS